ncbi:hypothetical protein K3495_g5951 [Podosphaera aphanis]|nr:hypothetical protein K3495_g5951 [Podosphaera aphanis]
MFSNLRGKTYWMMVQGNVLEGVFAVNKPSGISSAQVLRDLQSHFNPSKLFEPWLDVERRTRSKEPHNQRRRRRDNVIQVKIGHGGTLDPLATGVLITGVGRGTKSLQDFLKCTKVYETVVLFGTSTDTYDCVGKVLKRAPTEHVTKEMVEKALENFRGKYMQLPPLFSALKMDGKPLYEYAREGKKIPREIERRPVEVLELEIVEWMEGGTHSYVAPTDEAGYAEINVANQLWNQESSKDKIKRGISKELEPPNISSQTDSQNNHVASTSQDKEEINDNSKARGEEETPSSASTSNNECSAPELLEIQKRKSGSSQDDLESNRPPKKQQNHPPDSSVDDAVTSGDPPGPSNEGENALDKKSQKPPPAVRLRMTVTSGFYVRSLCHDLGVAVGSAAIMAELQRTRQSDFVVGENTLEYTDLKQGENVWGPKVEQWLKDWMQKHPATIGAQESSSRFRLRKVSFDKKENEPKKSADAKDSKIELL